MRVRTIALSLALVTLPMMAPAQLSSNSSTNKSKTSNLSSTAAVVNPKAVTAPNANNRPFSRVAFGGGISLLGVHLLAATNLNPYLDLRGDGRFFQYNAGNYNTNGFDITPQLNLASAGISVDFYPFPRHGFRLSPGLLFYNNNGASSSIVAEGGTSFTLNNNSYYSSTSNPVTGTATLSLHSQKPAFTITTGWGSFFPSKGGHWSFPFEIGVAFIGTPKVNMTLTSGQTCDYTGANCVDVTSNQQLQSDLQSQISKYDKDLDPLKTFPMISGGIVYNFRVRPR